MKGTLQGETKNTHTTDTAQTLHTPQQITNHGTLFITDSDNHTIRQISADGTVSTLCGCPVQSGSTDGKGSAARFKYPTGIAVSPNGTLFVTDKSNHTIRQIST